MKTLCFHLVVLLVLVSAIQCPQHHDPEAKTSDTIFQLSVLDALMAGIYNGAMSFGELRQYGNFGLGTFNALDGEMVTVNDTVYQIRADGTVCRIGNSDQTPFAVITFFTPDTVIRVGTTLIREQIEACIDKALISPNIPVAIKITGFFENVRTRSVPRQQRPYPPLSDVLKTQPEFDIHSVYGTVVGFRLPLYMKNMNAPLYHFHFLTADRSAGGHLLNCNGSDLRIELDYKHHLSLQLPRDEDFRNVNFQEIPGIYH
ncbi:MAG: acetolactate decarboxylase [Fidelibacterota bacterium]